MVRREYGKEGGLALRLCQNRFRLPDGLPSSRSPHPGGPAGTTRSFAFSKPSCRCRTLLCVLSVL